MVVEASVVDVAGSDVDVAGSDGAVVAGSRRDGAAPSSSGPVQADPKRAVDATRTNIAFVCIYPVLRPDPGPG